MIVKSQLLDGEYLDQTYKVRGVKNYLPKKSKEGREFALVQFWNGETGGLHTIKARDIVKITRK